MGIGLLGIEELEHWELRKGPSTSFGTTKIKKFEIIPNRPPFKGNHESKYGKLKTMH